MEAVARLEKGCLVIEVFGGWARVCEGGNATYENLRKNEYYVENLYKCVVEFFEVNLSGGFKIVDFRDGNYEIVGGLARIIRNDNKIMIDYGDVWVVFEFGASVQVWIGDKKFWERVNLDEEGVIDEVLFGIVYKDGKFEYDGKVVRVRCGRVELLRVEGESVRVGKFALVYGELIGVDKLIDWATGLAQGVKDIEQNGDFLVLRNDKCMIRYLVDWAKKEAEFVQLGIKIGNFSALINQNNGIINYSEKGKILYLGAYLGEQNKKKIINFAENLSLLKYYLF